MSLTSQYFSSYLSARVQRRDRAHSTNGLRPDDDPRPTPSPTLELSLPTSDLLEVPALPVLSRVKVPSATTFKYRPASMASSSPLPDLLNPTTSSRFSSQKSLLHSMITAINSDDLAKLRSCLRSESAAACLNSYDISDYHRRPPLHLAVVAGSLAAVGILLPYGTRYLNRWHQTALHLACLSGDYEITSLLLSVDPQLWGISDQSQRMPLHYAILGMHPRIVLLIIDTAKSHGCSEEIDEVISRISVTALRTKGLRHILRPSFKDPLAASIPLPQHFSSGSQFGRKLLFSARRSTLKRNRSSTNPLIPRLLLARRKIPRHIDIEHRRKEPHPQTF